MGSWGAKRPDAQRAGSDELARSVIAGCAANWVELKHITCYPEDRGQEEPAAGTPYRLAFADGSSLEGRLDEAGFARHDGIPEGPVRVEYEPDIDETVKAFKEQLRTALSEIVAAERAEQAAIEKELEQTRVLGLDFPGSHEIAKAGIYAGAVAKGVWNGVVGIVGSAWDLLNGAGAALYGLSLRINPVTAPRKFAEDLQALKSAYIQLQRFADEDLAAYVILMDDRDVYAMLGDFAKELLEAQHALELTEAGGGIALDIALTVLTGGAGAAANARHVGKLKRLKALADKLVDALKRRKRRKAERRDSSRKRIVTRVPLHRVRCFAPGPEVRKGYKRRNPNRTDADFYAEYDRQLKMQEDGLNGMTAEEYLAGRKRFMDGGIRHRDPSEATHARKMYHAALFDKYYEAYRDAGKSAVEAKRMAVLKAEAEMKTLAALHNPDLEAGGKDVIGAFGDRGVNSSIGRQWATEERLKKLDETARKMVDAGQSTEKLKASLTRCKK